MIWALIGLFITMYRGQQTFSYKLEYLDGWTKEEI